MNNVVVETTVLPPPPPGKFKKATTSSIMVTAAVAREFGCQPARIRAMVKAGQLTPLRGFARPLRFHRTAVEKALGGHVLPLVIEPAPAPSDLSQLRSHQALLRQLDGQLTALSAQMSAIEDPTVRESLEARAAKIEAVIDSVSARLTRIQTALYQAAMQGGATV